MTTSVRIKVVVQHLHLRGLLYQSFIFPVLKIDSSTMEFASVPHPAKLALILSGTFIIYQLVVQLAAIRKRRAIAREKGCLPPPIFPQWETILGIDLFRSNMRAIKAHSFLELSYNRFIEMGVNTMQFVALGRKIIITIEPENLKTIQDIEFKKWCLVTRRKVGFRPLLGDVEFLVSPFVSYLV